MFGAGVRANLDPDGRLINVGSDARADLQVDSVEPGLSALDGAARGGRLRRDLARRRGRAPGPERVTTFASGDRASLTLGGDPARLAWRVLVHADATHVYDALVDGRPVNAAPRQPRPPRDGRGLRQLPGRAAGRQRKSAATSPKRARTLDHGLRGCSATTPTSTRTPTTHRGPGPVAGPDPRERDSALRGGRCAASPTTPARGTSAGQGLPADIGLLWDGFVPGFSWTA